MKGDKITVILLITLFFLSMVLVYVAKDKIQSVIKISNKVEPPKQCQNLTMMKTAYCLNRHVNSIYKYKVTPDIKKLTVEELEEKGGDCNNWADLYIGYAEYLEFNTKKVIVNTGGFTQHAFAIISDTGGYCILDQREITCTILEELDTPQYAEQIFNDLRGMKNKTLSIVTDFFK